MIYEDITSIVYSLNTGNIPDKVDFLTKLVCGKVARKRLPSLIREADITTAGDSSFNLRTTLPDFFDFKTDIKNNSKIIYSLDSSGNPIFYPLLSTVEFAQQTEYPCAKKEGSTLTINYSNGVTAPDNIYFPYYSFYCFEDGTLGTRIETPISSDDICILPPLFDDVIIDGILLYISRKEKESKEYEKNVVEWEKRVNEIIYYS